MPSAAVFGALRAFLFCRALRGLSGHLLLET